jgi:hypothetical protein
MASLLMKAAAKATKGPQTPKSGEKGVLSPREAAIERAKARKEKKRKLKI